MLSRPHRENGKRARDDRKNKQARATFLLSLPIVARRAFFFLSSKSPFNKKGPLRTREKNALNSDSSVREFFLESIIINIFTIEILRLPGNVGFKKLFGWVTNCQFSTPSIDVLQHTLALKMITALVVETSVTDCQEQQSSSGLRSLNLLSDDPC